MGQVIGSIPTSALWLLGYTSMSKTSVAGLEGRSFHVRQLKRWGDPKVVVPSQGLGLVFGCSVTPSKRGA